MRKISTSHPRAALLAAGALAAIPLAHGASIETGIEELKLTWDTTLKYTLAARTKSASATLVASPNADDGDRNLAKGLVSNRLDIFSELDLAYRNHGLRISGAGWYDAVYNRRNDNNSALTANATSVANDRFPDATRKLMGRKAEVLDAFAYGSVEIAELPTSWRLGRHSLLYGESLFFGANGIAGGQAPIDYIKLLSVPSTQFKELVRPQPQVSGQIQLKPNLSLGAYYQFRWERDRLPPVGSYFSAVDLLDDGGEQAIVIPGAFAFSRGPDIKARNSGQGGAQVRWRPEDHAFEYGIYAVRFHAKGPVAYTNFAIVPGLGPVPTSYQLVFPEDIKAFGASATTSIGNTNFAAEASVRRNMPLVAAGGNANIFPGAIADNRNSPAYPVGSSAHVQLSWITVFGRTAAFDSASFLGEVAWNRRVSVDRNAAALDPNSTRDASAMRVSFQPTWFQVIPGLDLSAPFGLGYGISGKSSVLHPGFSVPHGGDVSIGLSGVYQQRWNFSLSYVQFFGKEATATDASLNYTYGQVFKDRNLLTFSMNTTF